MPKLVEVKMPPLDGTEFVVVWVNTYGTIISDRGFADDGVFSMENYDTEEWENDLDARYFVAAD